MPASILRPVDPARDAEAIATIYAPAIVGSTISFEITPPDAAEITRRIAHYTATHPWLVCETGSGEIVGYAYGCQHRERAAYRWAADVSVYIRTDSHRRGLGRALYTSLFALLRLQGFHVACAGVTLPNPGSTGLHEALGFTPVGTYRAIGYKDGRWRDVRWYQLFLQTPPDPAAGAMDLPPGEPLVMAALREHAGFDAALGAGRPLLR